MSARDELAYVIVQHPWHDPELFGVANWPKGYCPTCGKIIEAGHNSPAHAEHIADAILAAGYRKPQEVTTVEELDALPRWSVIRDRTGYVGQRFPGGWRVLVVEPRSSPWLSDTMEDVELPATVLHVGSVEA